MHPKAKTREKESESSDIAGRCEAWTCLQWETPEPWEVFWDRTAREGLWEGERRGPGTRTRPATVPAGGHRDFWLVTAPQKSTLYPWKR